MSSQSVEHQLEALNSRLGRIERKLNETKTEKTGVFDPLRSLTHFFRRLTPEDASHILGAFLISASLLALFINWLEGTALNPLLGVWLAIGVWLSVRHAEFFGVSDSTLELLKEDRAARHLKATHVHHAVKVHPKPMTPERQMQLTFLLLGAVGLAILYSWSIFYYVSSPAWQLFSFLVVMMAALSYSLTRTDKSLAYLCVVATYVMMLSSHAPLFAILCMALFTAGMTYYAVQRQNWTLLLMVVMATYVSITRWVLYFSGFGISEVLGGEAILAEILLIFTLVFTLPFVYRRRSAGEREVVRTILITNALSFTLLASWLSYRLIPDRWFLSYVVAILGSAALSCLSWLEYGRFSYAKYFSAASLVALLVGSLVNFQPSLVTLIWFMVSVVVLTVGFIFESYTARLMGLFILLGAVLHYLFATLVDPMAAQGSIWLHERVWLGLLMSGFLFVVALWFQQLHSRGPEEKYRPMVIFWLFLASFSMLASLIIAELIKYVV